MSQLEMMSGSMRAEHWELSPAQLGLRDSRTLLRQCLLEVVLPLGAILAMSALTAGTIVVVVTTVARASLHF
jgi:hypothetical protein